MQSKPSEKGKENKKDEGGGGCDSAAAMASSSRRSWGAAFRDPTDVFRRSGAEEGEDEENLKWAALEKLPTYDRMRKGILQQVVVDGRVVCDEVDVHRLAPRHRKLLLDRLFKVVEGDNERFLERLRHRIDRLLRFLQESPHHS